MNRHALLAGTLCMVVLVAVALSLCEACGRGYDIWFAGRVIAVNAREGLIRIARGPTETRDAAVVDCTITRRAIRHIYRGMQVEAEVDTRSEPWHILHLMPLEYRVRPLLHAFSYT